MRKDEMFGAEPKISLADLISLNELQEMQDSFSEVANVTIRTVDLKGRFLTATSHLASLCSEEFMDRGLREQICIQCLPTFLGGKGIVDDELSFECLPGLKNYLIPLKVTFSQTTSLILGYMIIGPVIFMKRKERQEYKEITEKFGYDLNQLWSLILELRIFSYKGIHSFLDMIGNMTNHILNLAYAKVAMQKKILRDFSGQAHEKSVAVSDWFQEFLELFLDFIMDITKGHIGSVMLLEPHKKELVIRASRGLSTEIIQKTSVKLGEGISGLSAQTKRPFLINEDSMDEAITGRLKRPDLFSSIVVPIKYHDEVYGVLNVSSERSLPVRFDESTLSHLTKLARLTATTLEHIQR